MPRRKPSSESAGTASLDLAALNDLAGATYWKRGEAYFRDGHAELQSFDATAASAVVLGSEPYRVELRHDASRSGADAWRGTCACPLGQDGETCKHIVAAALSWQAALAGETADADGAIKLPPPAGSALAAFLREQSAEALAERLLAIADEHRDVHRALTFWMQTTRADTPQALRQALSAMIGSPGLLDWRGSSAFARRLDPLLELLHETLAANPARAVSACEYVLSRLIKIYARSDDSGGAIGEQVAEVAELHARACTAAAGNPLELAATLLKLQEADEWNHFPIRRYAPALGAAGLDAYGARLRKRWRALPPAPKADRYGFDSERVRLKRLLEQFLVEQADVDGLLELKGSDLGSAFAFLDLAQTCLQHGREKAALDWAERGLKAFPDEPRLQVLLADFYQRDGLDDEALALRWKLFEGYSGPEAFLALKAAAASRWPNWRERALALVKTRESAAAGRQRMPLQRPVGSGATRPVSLRVQLHLAEAQIADALAAADEGDCSPQILQRLALAAEAASRTEAAKVYSRLIPALLSSASGRYDEVVALIQRRARLVKPGDARAFEAELRAKHKAKRNFIKLLDGLPANR